MIDYENIERKIRLVKASLEGELSENDRRELETWLNKSQTNQKIYEQIRSKQKLAEKLEYYQQTDWEADWEVVIRHTRKIPHRRFTLRWLGYAAVLTGVIFAAGIWIKQQSEKVPSTVNMIVNSDPIRPGVRQAYIELVSGERIVLGETQKGFVKNIDGGMLKQGQEGLMILGNDSLTNRPETPEYNRIIVPRGGEYQLVLADGTQVWMNSDSKLEIPVAFTGSERRVRLQGEAYFQVKRNEKSPFRVEVNDMEITVLGTSFNIHAYGENMRTTLVEGAVALNVGGKAFRLTPGEEASINAGIVKVEKVDVYERIAWKEGKFVFREKRLEEVMDILGRWYDVEVFYQNTAIKELHFTGNIPRHATIHEVLKFLEHTRLVRFGIDGRTVMVFN